MQVPARFGGACCLHSPRFLPVQKSTLNLPIPTHKQRAMNVPIEPS